jgi:23S rRNA pseudouridine2605 synthase
MNATDPDAMQLSTSAAEADLDPAPTEAPVATPVRRRAPRRKTAAASSGDAAAVPVETAGEPGPSPTEMSGGEAGALDAPGPASAPAGTVEAGDRGAEAFGEVGGTPADGEARPPRNRNRRRGRRGRAGREAAAGAPGAEGGTTVEIAEPPAAALAPQDPDVLFAALVAGDFDVEPAEPAEAPVPPKRVLAAEPDAPKLHKLLAQAGVGSRRDMEQMILEGRITVNGEPAHIGQRISWGDQVKVGGKPIKLRIAPPPPRVLAYHKPVGEVVTHDDPQQRPTVFRRLPKLHQGKWQSVGRLDINTEGLLLFTNSGELANQLMHPRFGVEREYAVRVLGRLDDEARQRLLDGVEIDGQTAQLKSVEDGGGEGVNHWYRVVITEGRNREVRRLFDAVGLTVSRLIRIRYGTVVLPRGLKRGVWVELGDVDVKAIRRLAQAAQPARSDEEGAGRGRRRRRPRAGARSEGAGDRPEGGPIPNPLRQTYDKRALQRERAAARPDLDEDGPIPNPLQQTYDKRALQRDRAPRREVDEDGPIPNPLQQTYDKRFVQKERGPANAPRRRTGAAPAAKKAAGGAGRQPDPMQTSVGYIGADAFLRKGGRGGPGGGRGGSGGRRGGR